MVLKVGFWSFLLYLRWVLFFHIFFVISAVLKAGLNEKPALSTASKMATVFKYISLHNNLL